MSDDFFDDEQELMEAEQAAAPVPAPAKNASATKDTKAADKPATSEKPAPQAGTRQAPPFWMVLAIAIIALLLGVVIGYLLGTSATLAELSASASSATTQTSSESDSTSGVELPEGHPQLNIADDGTATVAGSDSGSASE